MFSYVIFNVALICSVASSRCLNGTVVLSHVIFRHGERTPSRAGLWQNNPYYNESYYDPYGYGQLTNEGKMTMYNLGRSLRSRYEDNLLNGTYWTRNIYEARSTDSDRTKMSLMLVLGGLFPVKDPVLWNDNILWQPIPYEYLPADQDKELSSWACPRTVPLIYEDSANMEKLHSYDGLIETLSENIGETYDYITALDLYFGMYIQKELGFPLDNWTEAVYPEPLKQYIVDFYYIETSTLKLKTVIAGYLLKKIIEDTLSKINNTLERKIFLYSGHEVNVGTILAALELHQLTDPPPYASYILFELHLIGGKYGIKIYYQDYKRRRPKLLRLKGCKKFCLIDEFVKLLEGILPKGNSECFGEE